MDQQIATRLGVCNRPADPDPEAGQSVNVPTQPERAEAEPAERMPSPSASLERSTVLSGAQVIDILDQVTGINVRIGEIIVAEIGTGVDRFPTQAHICSWAGLCPQANISAGKQLSKLTGKGNRWLRQALIEAANAAARSKSTFLGAYYQRLRKRMGHKKATVALAHRLLVLIYALLKHQQPYQERDRTLLKRKLSKPRSAGHFDV